MALQQELEHINPDMVPAVYTVNQIFCNGGRLGIQKV